MKSWVRAPKDFAAGILFLVIGVGAACVAQNYAFGEARRMGPGYFPTYAGLALALLGVIIALRSLVARGAGTGGWAIRPVIFVVSSPVVFAALIKPGGLLVSCAAVVLLSSFASARSRSITTLTSAVILSAFAGAVFSYGLGLPMPLFGTWFAD